MGRGRGKGKKQSLVTGRDDAESGEDEKLPVRKRGRPQKPLKDDIKEEDEVEKIEADKEEDGHDAKDNKNTLTENGRKRKRASQVKEITDSVKVEKGIGTKTNGTDLIKPVGYRNIGSRRKNKPRRAAEVGFDCHERF